MAHSPTAVTPTTACGNYINSATLDIHDSSEEDSVDSEALAPGDRIGVLSRPALVLYFQSIVSTFMQNVLPPLKLYVFMAYLHSSSENYNQLLALENLAWTCRVFFAVLSDFVPVFGRRRQFWLCLGWVLTCVSLAVMGFSKFGAPFCDPEEYPKCWNPMGKTPKEAYDPTAPSRVAWYRAPTFFATFGVVLVAANVDGLMVEYAQKEPIATRGQIQAIVYALTGTGGLMARFFFQILLNGKRYGGNYDFSVGASVPYLLSLGMCVAALAVALAFLRDTPRPFVPFGAWCSGLWALLQNRAVFQLLAFRFFYYLFNNVYGNPIVAFQVPPVRWVTNLDLGWINITPRLLFVPATAYVGRNGLQWNWRTVAVSATALNIALTAFATFFVIYDVCRNAWFYTAVMVLTGIPVAINYIIQGFVMVEFAGVGYEAVIAGLWATLKDINVPIALKWHNFVTDQFPVKSMLLLDDDHTRNQVAATHGISFAIQVVGLAWFVLVPGQKLAMRALKQMSPSRLGGALIIVGYLAQIIFSWQQNIDAYTP
ncbi:transmembrane protein [Achlya hypogyna]|uniref:Transmembrane protein n=1 Tax=Achlya hypogyna TaxID=1202772 RepID=A0A1V9YE12_ACHHY|nr:transmembrane protein [Achlya hypogyna]